MRTACSTRAWVITLLLLVLAAALCTKALGSAAMSAAPPSGSQETAVAAHAAASEPDSAAGAEDGTRCAKKPPSTETQTAPQPADTAAAHAVAEPDAPRRAPAQRAVDVRAGPAPPAPRHLLLSILRI
ncbi:hypothetical protein [Actinomadura bangladeshensis]|uniref:Uncharacterized protein n=1 Tax=Actinomadura bangladeshensis TaxID=453573 RepID=A0A6L9QDM7_9ACTN|nr:hypothetical protein [Actinomadura bangladeshensis]NEA22324.1 hypothetical protein [Actinomadura bangladeshensis]